MITKIIGDKEYKLIISQDDIIESPREGDNIGTFIMTHKNYNLGDEKLETHGNNFEEDFAYHINGKYNIIELEYDCSMSTEEQEKIYDWISNNIIYRDVYIMDHSGISLSTKAFGCRFDSGQIGYIYAHKDLITKELILNEGDDGESRLLKILDEEIKTLNQYLSGEIYRFCIETRDMLIKDGKTFYTEWEYCDSCGGFYLEEVADGVQDFSNVFTKEEIKFCEITY